MKIITRILSLIAVIILVKFFYSYFNYYTIVIPTIGIVIIWFLGNKYLEVRKKPILPALAIEGGHLIWLLVVFFIIAALRPESPIEKYQFNIFELLGDIIVFGALIIWLWRRPGKISGIFNLIFLIQAITGNIYTLYEINFNLDIVVYRAILIHILLRVSAIIALIIGMRKLKAESASQFQPL